MATKAYERFRADLEADVSLLSESFERNGAYMTVEERREIVERFGGFYSHDEPLPEAEATS